MRLLLEHRGDQTGAPVQVDRNARAQIFLTVPGGIQSPSSSAAERLHRSAGSGGTC